MRVLGYVAIAASLAVGSVVSGHQGQPAPPASADACPFPNVNEITVSATGGTYRAVTDASTGSAFFSTGQNADILVSGIDFDNTGGSQLFNHPAGIASDGTKLAITDTFNNRVLIWNTPPASNVAPDVVLGQANFTTNSPGTGRSQMNWPVSVSIGGGKLFVSDTNNHRILIWNSIPTASGTAASVIINRAAMGPYNETWPWGIWSDGTKLVVAATLASRILVWNTVPVTDDVGPSFALDARDSGGTARTGTPRHVFSNGSMLLVGDHNATVPNKAEAGTFVWTTFPTSASSPYTYFLVDTYVEPTNTPWLKGTFIGNALWAFGRSMYSWISPPASETAAPNLTLSSYDYMKGGDYGGVAFAGGKLYLASGNGNRIVGFNAPPTTATAVPDFTIGSTGYCTNTLDTNYFIQNGVPRSDGQSLFVSSDFDRKLYVWRNIPDQSNPPPDYVYRLPFQPWAMALRGTTLALGGERSIYIWETLPSAGGMPSRQLRDTVGGIQLQRIRGVAMDANNFYATDDQNDKLYVWNGLPTSTSSPAFSINITDPQRIVSDGTYLAVTSTFTHQIKIYAVNGLNANSLPVKIIGGGGPGVPSLFNLPQDAYIGNGRLFVADSSFNRVVGWSSLDSAINGAASDLVIGESSLTDYVPEIGRNKSFSPAAVWYDGRFLWVGEMKFSTRLMRYSPPCSYHQLSSPSQSTGAAAISGTVAVTPNDATCAWTVTSNASFLTVTSGSGGTGTATVAYDVAANTAAASRTGTLTIGGRLFTVTQAGTAAACTFTLSATAASVSASAGNGSVNVVAGAGCGWTAASNASWLTLTAGATGSGNATVSYSVAANTSTSARIGTVTIAGQTFTVTQSAPAAVALDRASLNFAATSNGAAFVAQTAPQQVRLTQSGSGTVTWAATSNRPWLTVSPSSGSGAAVLSIGTQFVAGLPATSTGAVTLTLTGAANTVPPIAATLSVLSSTTSASPIGSFDTPVDNSTGLTGSIAATGWALDDVEVTQVQIWRDPNPGDPPGAIFGGGAPQGGKVLVGYASFVEGARPDVQTANSTVPLNSRAGWGYLMLTRGLIWDGKGAFKLYAIAQDREGHLVQLGSKTISIDNATATKPFGAIDSPGQGATATGLYPNTGWVLTPNAGATISAANVQVAIDGVFLPGVPSVSDRTDITAGFPTFTTTGAGRGLFVDTTQYANGAHTIGWLVTDSTGKADGVGSRFFTVANGAVMAGDAPDSTSRVDVDALPPAGSRVAGRRGFDRDQPLEVLQQRDGRPAVHAEELDRIEVRLDDRDGGRYTGYTRVGDRFAPLPIGSHLEGPTFTWQPGAGFLGRYDLVFVREHDEAAVARQNVSVTIHPQGTFTRPQVVIDTPAREQAIDGPFTLAGWALDPAARTGIGISTVHAWAYPVRGGTPIFLGSAALGGRRPDVAALYGQHFQDAGFRFLTRPLPEGTYDIAVFAWSATEGGFLPARVVRIIVP